MDTKIPAKKMKRLEKKKQKVAAFLELVKPTNEDSLEPSVKNRSMSSVSSSSFTGMGPWTPVSKTNSDTIDQAAYNISSEEYMQLKSDLKKRKKYLMAKPTLRLKEVGEKASISMNEPGKIIPLFAADIQHLLFFPIFGGPYHPPYLPPRWCYFERSQKVSQIIVFVVEGASSYTFFSNESQFPTLSKEFEIKAEFVSPFGYQSDIAAELSVVKLNRQEEERLNKRFGKITFMNSADSVAEHKKLKSAFPIDLFENYLKESCVPNESSQQDEKMDSTLSICETPLPATDKFSRVLLLLSPHQMLDENYPLPLPGELALKYSDFKFTKDTYSEVTAHSPLFGLDCEMCLSAEGQELTRIALVNEKHEVIYDSLVKPTNKIINYLTQYSGITKNMLVNVTKTLEDVQDDIRAILPADAILVGQSLNMDLQAMKMMHPYVIDTSVIFNLSGVRRHKPKLSKLASEFLNMEIQSGDAGHDSVEDSLASLKLVQLKLMNSIDFGDAVTNVVAELSEIKCKIDEEQGKNITRVKSDQSESEILLQYWQRNTHRISSLFRHTILDKKTAAVIGCQDIMDTYSSYLPKEDSSKMGRIVTSGNEETVVKTCSLAEKYFFNVSHITINPEKASDVAGKIDDWCKQIRNSIKENGLLIVLFPGSKKTNANGLAFVKIVFPPCPIPTRNTGKNS
ncbi:unnamed protein product [Bemisia tabaci]|uniref:Exonuclease domain-containing protein n=1 Tax=Bemisia tabaci TaxID=7038 RepID=A0A9P0F427_BEMTA|nr:unnamed protein product [Bemisia tabaci]